MRDVPFQTGGPLPSNSPVYVGRRADQVALRHLHQMHYLQLTESRQQGKTSLIYHLRSRLSDSGFVFAYVDAEGLKHGNYAEWCTALTDRLTTQFEFVAELRRYFSEEYPLHSHEWRDCLAYLGRVGQQESKKIVIALDEIGSVPAEWAESFFRVLREAYVVREVEPYFKHITFILAGAFDPRDLIADSKISPFNVAQRVHLEDFTPDELGQLVAHLELPVPRVSRVADRLAYWTDGQPYLAQKICSHLAESEDTLDASAVDDAVERFFREDTNHLPRISKDLEADPELLDYARGVVAGDVKFSPAVNSAHFQLAHVIGVIKPDEHGFCRIRNRMYEQALAEIKILSDPHSTDELVAQTQDAFRYDAFISYSHHDSPWVRNVLLPHLEGEDLRVCIDFRDFEPGLASLVNMENAVERSRKTLIVLTPEWVESEWTAFESLLVQTDDPAGRRARMIPLQLKSCKPPKRIAILTYVDFTQPSEIEFQLQRLVAAIGNEPMADVPRPVPEPCVVSGESQEPSTYDDQHLRARKESLEKELAETVDDMAKVEKQYRATTSVIERNRLDQELESLREHHERVYQEYDSVCHIVREKPSASQPGSPKISDLRLFVVGPAGEQSTSRLEFSIPAGDPSEKAAWEIAFNLYLDNQGPTMAHYVDVEMYAISDTDCFWIYDYKSEPFDIVESPRPWQTTLSNTYIHCRFVGGGDFACDSKVQQNLGLVKMLVPYGQADTTLTFQYHILAKGHKSQGSFVIAFRPER